MLVHVDNILAYTPHQAIEMVSRAGVKKANMPPHKIFLSAVSQKFDLFRPMFLALWPRRSKMLIIMLSQCSAGALLGFAGACTLTMNASPWLSKNAPGLLRILGAIIFPLGLVMIIFTGADLFTGTNMARTRHNPWVPSQLS